MPAPLKIVTTVRKMMLGGMTRKRTHMILSQVATSKRPMKKIERKKPQRGALNLVPLTRYIMVDTVETHETSQKQMIENVYVFI